MKKTYIVLGGIGLGIALIVTLSSVFLMLNALAKGKAFEYVATVDVPLESLSTSTSTPVVPTETPASAVSTKEHILDQIRQLVTEYEQAVQSEKQIGNVEYSQDPNMGKEIFLFKDNSYGKFLELNRQLLTCPPKTGPKPVLGLDRKGGRRYGETEGVFSITNHHEIARGRGAARAGKERQGSLSCA